MKAQEIKFKVFLSQQGTKFIIPVYQRNYDWTRKECLQIFNDIYNLDENESYFIGSIVHKRTEENRTNMIELVVIDGQQRITTLTLLIFVIYEVFKANGDDKCEEIWDYYIQNKHDDSKIKLKLKPIESDFNVLIDLIENNKEKLKESNRLYDNYSFFKEKIHSYEIAKKMYENFNSLIIVEIALTSEDEPQKIFQSLNSTGLELSQADLIRNYLLMDLEYSYQEEIYLNYWSKIEQNCIKKSKNESMLTVFFRDYLTLKFTSIPAYKAVFEMFKEKYPKIQFDKNLLEHELEEMNLYSSFYDKFLNPEKISNQDKELSYELENLLKIETTVSYPFLLGVFRDYEIEKKIDRSDVIRILELIQSFVFRRFICGVPTNALNKIFMSLYENSKKQRELNSGLTYYDSIELVLLRYSSYQRFPSDDEVLENLESRDIYYTQSKNKLYLLEQLENEYNGYRENRINLFERDDITIEHIFPQKPSKQWKETLSVEEYKEMSARVNTLANLTIVINNGSLGNRAFRDKRDLDQENSKGFKHSKFRLNEYLASIEDWNLETMDERLRILGQKFIKIWQYPKVELDRYKGTETDIELMQIDDPRNLKLKYYILNGNKTHRSTFITLYTDLIQYLYVDFFDQLFSPEIQNIVKVDQNKTIFNKPYEIQSGFFIESHLNEKEIISRLKAISESLDEPLELSLSLEKA